MSQTKAQLLNPLGDLELTGQLVGVGATFSGNVSIAGTLTKQDVTNVDSVGIVTIRSGGYLDVRTGSSINTNATGGWASGTIHKNTTSGEFALVSGGSGGNNYLTFYTSASAAPTERLRINSSGQTLINTTSANDGAVMLGVKNPTATDTVLDVVCGSTSHGSHVAFSDTEYARGIISYNHANNFLAFRTNGVATDRLHITSAGNIGIGTNNPSAILDARGNVQFGDGGGFDMNILGTRHQFSINGDEKLRIDSDGRLLVGINASTAADALVQSFKPTGNNSTIVVGNVATSSSGLARLDFAPSNSTVGARIECHATEDFSDGSKRTADLVFVTRKDGAQSEKLRIGSAGQIGIAGANYGTAGQVLASGGSGATPSWTTISAAPEVEGTASGAITAHKSCVVNTNGTISQVVQNIVPSTITNADTEVGSDTSVTLQRIQWISSTAFVVLVLNSSSQARRYTGHVASNGTISIWGLNYYHGNSEGEGTAIALDTSNNTFVNCQTTGNDFQWQGGVFNSSGSNADYATFGSQAGGSGGNQQYRDQYSKAVASNDNGEFMIAFGCAYGSRIRYRTVVVNAANATNNYSDEAGHSDFIPTNSIYTMTMEYIPSVEMYLMICDVSGTFRSVWVKSNGTGSAPTITADSSSSDLGITGNMPVLSYDSVSGKAILSYRSPSQGDKPCARVLSFTGSSSSPAVPTVGSEVQLTQESCDSITHVWSPKKQAAIFYIVGDDNHIKCFSISGTTLVDLNVNLDIFANKNYEAARISICPDDNLSRVLVATRDEDNSNKISISCVDIPIITTNLTEENFIGFAADSYADTATAKVKVVGNTTTQSGLTTAQKYYIKWDGTLSTSSVPATGQYVVPAGRALSSTSLLIQPA